MKHLNLTLIIKRIPSIQSSTPSSKYKQITICHIKAKPSHAPHTRNCFSRMEFQKIILNNRQDRRNQIPFRRVMTCSSAIASYTRVIFNTTRSTSKLANRRTITTLLAFKILPPSDNKDVLSTTVNQDTKHVVRKLVRLTKRRCNVIRNNKVIINSNLITIILQEKRQMPKFHIHHR